MTSLADYQLPAPRTADEAASRLLAEGLHVHLVSDNDTRCTNNRCTPTPVRGLLGTTPHTAPHPHTKALTNLLPLT